MSVDSDYTSQQTQASPIQRYSILACCCITILACHYCMDGPSAIENQMETEFSIKSTQWSLLFSCAKYPTMVVPFISGIIIDRINARNGLLIFTILLGLGQGLFMAGGVYHKFWLMVVGRAIFGPCLESVMIAILTLLSKVFLKQ